MTLVIVPTKFVKPADGRKWGCCSTIPIRFPSFLRWSTSGSRAETGPESKSCRSISEGWLITSASATAACSSTRREILGAVALRAAALSAAALTNGELWRLFSDPLGDGLFVASGFLGFLELVWRDFFGFLIQPQRYRRDIVPHRTIIFGVIRVSCGSNQRPVNVKSEAADQGFRRGPLICKSKKSATQLLPCAGDPGRPRGVRRSARLSPKSAASPLHAALV